VRRSPGPFASLPTKNGPTYHSAARFALIYNSRRSRRLSTTFSRAFLRMREGIRRPRPCFSERNAVLRKRSFPHRRLNNNPLGLEKPLDVSGSCGVPLGTARPGFPPRLSSWVTHAILHCRRAAAGHGAVCILRKALADFWHGPIAVASGARFVRVSSSAPHGFVGGVAALTAAGLHTDERRDALSTHMTLESANGMNRATYNMQRATSDIRRTRCWETT
jgi:hypothetical protein